jgi:glycosyl transferase, family 25
MKTFVINLDRRADRLQAITKLLAAHAIAFERIPAVIGATAPRPQGFDVVLEWLCHGGSLAPTGGLGCFASHQIIWRKIVDENIAHALVLEDDATIVKWSEHIREFSPAALGLDMLRIGANNLEVSKARSHVKPTDAMIGDLLLLSGNTAGTCAYIITKAGAEKCLAARSAWFPIDDYGILSDVYGVKSAVIDPVVFQPDGSTSDIDYKHAAPHSTVMKNLRIQITRLGRAVIRKFYRP